MMNNRNPFHDYRDLAIIDLEISKISKDAYNKNLLLPDNYEDIMEIWRKGAITARKAMSLLNMNSTTFYRKAKETS